MSRWALRRRPPRGGAHGWRGAGHGAGLCAATDGGAEDRLDLAAEHLGSDTFLHLHVEGAGLQTVRTGGKNDYHPGEQLWLSPEPNRIYRFDRAGQALG